LRESTAISRCPSYSEPLKRYIYTARFFWNQVALHHSFATGGHGRNEYFGRPDLLNDMVGGRTVETCNVYKLKLTRELFSVEPDTRYADFHERALFNHIEDSKISTGCIAVNRRSATLGEARCNPHVPVSG
jgi:hypothetical protein